MYSFALDRSRSFLTVTLTGFWTPETTSGYEQALRDELRALRGLKRPTACIIDATAFPVQSKETTARLGALLAGLGELKADRWAVAVAGGLGKMQAMRVEPAFDHGIFASAEEARAFVLG